MIENIKRFVNEHQTLIVVIVGVLVICFLYWWLCWKDRALQNRVKGGISDHKSKFAAGRGGEPYQCIFAKSQGFEGERGAQYNLIILNDEGIDKLRNMRLVSDYYLSYLLAFCLIETLEQQQENEGGGNQQQRDEEEKVQQQGDEEEEVQQQGEREEEEQQERQEKEEKELDDRLGILALIKDPIKLFDTGASKVDLKYTYEGDDTQTFDFVETLNSPKIRQEVRDEIKTKYIEFIDLVVKKMGAYFHFVSCVGQLGYKPLPCKTNRVDALLVYSKSLAGIVCDTKFKLIFNNFVNNQNNIRAWYKTEGIGAKYITKYYKNDNNGNIIDLDNKEDVIFSGLVDAIFEVLLPVLNENGVLAVIDNIKDMKGLNNSLGPFYKTLAEGKLRDQTMKKRVLVRLNEAFNANVIYKDIHNLIKIYNILKYEYFSTFPFKKIECGNLDIIHEKIDPCYVVGAGEGGASDVISLLENMMEEDYQKRPKKVREEIKLDKFDIEYDPEVIDEEKKKSKEYQVADIYPAYKLALTILFLMIMYPGFSDKIDIDDYKKMIAAYVLYVNSFNTYCNVKMQRTWNGAIHNEYVYEIQNGLGNLRMELSGENLVNAEITLIKKHIDYLDERHPNENVKVCAGRAFAAYDEKEVGHLKLLCEHFGVLDGFPGFDGFDNLRKKKLGYLTDIESWLEGKIKELENQPGDEAYKVHKHIRAYIFYLKYLKGRSIQSESEPESQSESQPESQQDLRSDPGGTSFIDSHPFEELQRRALQAAREDPVEYRDATTHYKSDDEEKTDIISNEKQLVDNGDGSFSLTFRPGSEDPLVYAKKLLEEMLRKERTRK